MILACDPGIHGAFASYDGERLAVDDMPTFLRPAGPRNTMRAFQDMPEVVSLLQHMQLFGAEILVIELVGGIPNQSAHGSFIFGKGTGVVIGAALGLGYRVEEVPAMTWKSALKVPSDKDRARDRASQLLPAWSNFWPLKKHDGRAEAGLLALYGWQVFGPGGQP